jgi:hypothetical protein
MICSFAGNRIFEKYFSRSGPQRCDASLLSVRDLIVNHLGMCARWSGQLP